MAREGCWAGAEQAGTPGPAEGMDLCLPGIRAFVGRARWARCPPPWHQSLCGQGPVRSVPMAGAHSPQSGNSWLLQYFCPRGRGYR